MASESFFIEFKYKGKTELAEVKPCCEKDSVYYYDIFIRNSYQFTLTPAMDVKNALSWKVSLKNADKEVDNRMIKLIGEEIEKHILSLQFETRDY